MFHKIISLNSDHWQLAFLYWSGILWAKIPCFHVKLRACWCWFPPKLFPLAFAVWIVCLPPLPLLGPVLFWAARVLHPALLSLGVDYPLKPCFIKFSRMLQPHVQALVATGYSQNLCTIVLALPMRYIGQLQSTFVSILPLHALTATAQCQISQMRLTSFHVRCLSQTMSQCNLNEFCNTPPYLDATTTNISWCCFEHCCPSCVV